MRPMTHADVDAVIAVVRAADNAAERQAGREPEEVSDERRARSVRGMHRFVDRDPDGAWVAVVDGAVVGIAESIRRGDFWGLSMLFVHPDLQGRGVGRELMDAALGYAVGARVRMIMTSEDPRALRRYSSAGLAIHPAVKAVGTITRHTIPADLRGRDGNADDLGLVADVDAGLGRSRAEDVEFDVSRGFRLHIVDDVAGRGFAITDTKSLAMLGATDEATAAHLMWRHLAESEGKQELYCLTAGQDWAVRVALAAGLVVSGCGPLFVDGMDRLPGPWIPSGWYF